MLVVCMNYHGSLTFPENKIKLEDLIPYTTKFYNHRPRMIKYHKNGITILVFTSLRFRLMGKGDIHKQILQDFLHMLPWKSHVGEMTCSMTVSHQLPVKHINLHKLDRRYFQVEMELFPAAKLIHKGHEHVNIFHSGKLIITGVRELPSIVPLIDHIMLHINSAIY